MRGNWGFGEWEEILDFEGGIQTGLECSAFLGFFCGFEWPALLCSLLLIISIHSQRSWRSVEEGFK